MSQISKQALIVDNNQSFPTNNVGEITPSDLRAFNVNMIESLVNEIPYQAFTSSVLNSLDNLNQFTASQQPTFNSLNAFTASQLLVNDGVNSFTWSANADIDALQVNTSNLNQFTSSINEIRDNGALQGYSTRFYFGGLVSASIVPNVNGAIASINIEQDGTKLNTSSFDSYVANANAWSASTDTTIAGLSSKTGSYATTGSNTFVATQTINADLNVTGTINAYKLNVVIESSSVIFSSGSNILGDAADDTQTLNGTVLIPNILSASVITGIGNVTAFSTSVDSRLDIIEAQTGSIAALNLFTASANTSTNALNQFTASQLDINAGYNTFTASANSRLTNLETTSASVNISITNINSFTSSADTKFTDIQSSTASLNTFTSSATGRLNSLESKTGSYATTGSNIFNGNQTITGSLALSGYSTNNVISASIANNTASIDLSLGSQFVLNLPASGETHINVFSASVGTTSLIKVASSGSVSASFSPNVKQPIGNIYTPTSGSTDMISLVTFDTAATVYATSIIQFQ